MTEYPNPQHYVRWETTYDLYNQIRTQLETFPASDAFLKQLIAKWRTIYKGPDPNEPIARILVDLARSLYNTERSSLCLPPYSEYLSGTLEGARYRDQLLALHYRVQWPDITLGYLSSLIERFFAIYVSNLPIAAFLQTDSSLADIPLLDTIDIRKVASDLISSLSYEAFIKYKVLDEVRAQITKNVEEISPRPDKPIRPIDFKGTSSDLVYAFFKNTPFETIFNVSLPV